MFRLTILLCAGLVAVMLTAEKPRGPVQAANFKTLPRPVAPAPGAKPAPVAKAEPAQPAVAAKPAPEPASQAPRAEITAQITSVSFGAATPGLLHVSKADAPAGHVSTIRTAPQSASAPTSTGALFEVSGNKVNLRAGPSTGHAIVGALTRGTRARVTGDAGDGWVELEVQATGQRGFMAQRFLAPAS